MYRILKASKDTYIQNKVVASSRSIDSNVGQAGTLDLFKLYDETPILSGTSDLTELSRILIKFDYSPVQKLTASLLDVSASNFQCFLNLKNIYGGQTTPHHFTIKVCPLAKDFDEGSGLDVVSFRDKDATNWVSASDSNGILSLWTVSGAAASGAVGDVNVDYFISGNLGAGSQSLTYTQFFERGDEDLLIDITPIVSASIFGNLPNYGYRISYSDPEETDSVTRFVKRFGSRHTTNKSLHPNLIIKWDGDTISDDSSMAFFDITNRLYIYNIPRGVLGNYVSASTQITGANCLSLTLAASKSVQFYTTSFSQTHSQSITYLTTSMQYFSMSFSASQLAFGNKYQTGVYYSDVLLSPSTNQTLNDFVDDLNYSVNFQPIWKSLDGTVLFASGTTTRFNRYASAETSFDLKNYVVNILNLKEYYLSSEHSKLRVFIQDYQFEVFALRLPRPAKSRIFKNMYWRLIDPYTKDIVIPFDDIGTKLSSDGDGMYFDFWFEDLEENKVYEFEFKIVEDDNIHYVTNQGFIFKVVK